MHSGGLLANVISTLLEIRLLQKLRCNGPAVRIKGNKQNGKNMILKKTKRKQKKVQQREKNSYADSRTWTTCREGGLLDNMIMPIRITFTVLIFRGIVKDVILKIFLKFRGGNDDRN